MAASRSAQSTAYLSYQSLNTPQILKLDLTNSVRRRTQTVPESLHLEFMTALIQLELQSGQELILNTESGVHLQLNAKSNRAACAEFRLHVQCVGERIGLMSNRTLLENILLPLRYHRLPKTPQIEHFIQMFFATADEIEANATPTHDLAHSVRCPLDQNQLSLRPYDASERACRVAALVRSLVLNPKCLIVETKDYLSEADWAFVDRFCGELQNNVTVVELESTTDLAVVHGREFQKVGA